MSYNAKSPHAREFINHDEIMATLDWVEKNKHNTEAVNAALDKARLQHGLPYREAALLLAADCGEQLCALAGKIKNDYYGSRIVLFAPLYLSNYCVNGCTYCPYHQSNKSMPRRKLTQDEIRREVIALQDMGHKRLAIEAGEHPLHNTIEYVLESIETIYSINHRNGAIRRVNVNIAATSAENYAKLHNAKIGTYLLFQETYCEDTYKRVHPSGPKADYAYHTEALDRAVQGGIEDVGAGVLFGLADYLYEVIALLMHAEHLEATYGVGPHTISVPRIRRAEGVTAEYEHSIDDDTFIKIVAALRVAAPYTGIIVSTRESEDCRRRALAVGASQISGGSRTGVGEYAESAAATDTQQFSINDERSLDEIVAWLLQNGQIPSFCTACYREGRVGEHFMDLAKSGQIKSRCQPNALITLQEYLSDYASDNTRRIGEKLIENAVNVLDVPKIRSFVQDKIARIKQGERDFRV
ncbi:MAG: [FeFe] hydrogenase H-cluster radical SAM maturase HydG [Oscillospiraceae bacterium]|nr:[FeFe] hydrogenase H-cluster radical SAM maturase HydG [Oscillospiraceae bacterium]